MVKEEKFIMAGGCAVRVSDTLEGERTVVLLHGYLESLDVWDRFTELLAPQVRVVAADLPGTRHLGGEGARCTPWSSWPIRYMPRWRRSA